MLDELLILKKIKGGDIKAFEELFRRYYFPVMRQALPGKWKWLKRLWRNFFMYFGKKGSAYRSFSPLKVTCIERLVINLCSIANTRKFGTDTVKLY